MTIIEKKYSEEQLNIIKTLSKNCHIEELTAKVLYGRGYETETQINNFLYPSKSLIETPYNLSGMQDAVKRISQAKDNSETVIIYGDYDADGICATTVLCKALKEYGIDAISVIPERENGYGLSSEIIDNIVEGYFPDLLITVDCGISAYEEVEYLKDLGVDVIVTDHHEIPEIIPDCIVINCKLKNQTYSFDSLSGAGVAYKLAYALIGDNANKYLDLVALATIADSMPLTGENRIIVKEGLEVIKSGQSDKPLKTLINLVGLKEITSASLAYGIAPRVNAAGRMGDACSSLKLFLSNSYTEIDELSNKLVKYNVERQVECEKVYKEAKEMLKESGSFGSVIVLANESWNTGLLGIVSAKICEEYYLPTILFTKSKDAFHGSARSIDSINIYEAISECEEFLLNFGGHSQAAGVTIDGSKLSAFANKLNEVVKNKTRSVDFERKIEVDGVIEGDLNKKFLKEITLFEPCGINNKKPLFLKKVDCVKANVIKNSHLSFSDGGLEYMYFNGVNNYELLTSNNTKSLIVEPTMSTYNGRDYVKGYVKFIADFDINGEDIYKKSLINCLESLTLDTFSSYKRLSHLETLEIIKNTDKNGYGNLFVLNNPNNLKCYKEIKFNKNLFEITEKNGKNCLLIGGLNKVNLSNYAKIIYLDKPLNMPKLNDIEILINDSIESFNVESLKTDREVFASVYKNLTKLIRLGVNNLLTAYNKCEEEISFSQFAFSSIVFKELGIIIEKDILYLDKTIKRDLNDSKLYKYILSLKK